MLFCVVVFALILGAILSLYGAIFRVVRANGQKSPRPPARRKSRRLLNTVLMILVAFVVCWGPLRHFRQLPYPVSGACSTLDHGELETMRPEDIHLPVRALPGGDAGHPGMVASMVYGVGGGVVIYQILNFQRNNLGTASQRRGKGCRVFPRVKPQRSTTALKQGSCYAMLTNQKVSHD